MPKLKVSPSIGYIGENREDLLEIDEDEWSDCETDEERQALIDEYINEWAWNYIELCSSILED